jgi:hypothetical protein
MILPPEVLPFQYISIASNSHFTRGITIFTRGYWLVALTILKHISQWGGLSHMENKKRFQTTT